MDIISLQEAKKAQRAVGDRSKLLTTHRDDTVGAINEIYKGINGSSLLEHNYNLAGVASGEVRKVTLPFIDKGMIRGIKVTTPTGDTGEFNLKIYTQSGGRYVYYSGKIIDIIWDIMEIPFMDESGNKEIYVVLENKGTESNFFLQIYVLKGV